jgi:hypothetical protein
MRYEGTGPRSRHSMDNREIDRMCSAFDHDDLKAPLRKQLQESLLARTAISVTDMDQVFW